MTALDRALINAFHRPAPRSGSALAEPPAAAPSNTRLRVAVGPAVPLSQALAELTAASSTPSGPQAGSREQGAGIEQGTGSLAVTPATPSADIAAKPTTAPVGPSIAALLDNAIHATTATEPTTVPASPSIRASAEHVFQATTVTVKTPSVEMGESEPAPAEAIAATGTPSTSLATQNVTISQDPAETSWRPLLQVDGVIWPSIHDRLQATAAAAIQQMTEGLLALCAAGNKVLGLASCASGEGVTTLLSAAAQNLLSQGRKVVMVDANWNNPQLAQNLGLLPQIGWEETLCGGLPLEEVVIESLADGLAVLPVREPSADTIGQGQIAASLDILAREFDVVLVDLGPLAGVEDETTFAHAAAARMDAVILVQNVRVTTPNRLAEVRQRLAASNMRYAGTIQNFVAG